MELNNLPEDYNAEKLGPQKRQTEFESEEAKLAYDAQGLIEKAKLQSERLGQPVDPITFAQRANDDIDALRVAIAEKQRAVNQDPPTLTESQKHEITPEQVEQVEQVMKLLKGRYDRKENRNLCPALDWSRAEKALRATPEALWTIDKAEKNGHEPAIYFSDETGFDIGTLAKESPQSTRNCVYDQDAERWLEENRPGEKFNGNAESQAAAMGWQLMEIRQGNHIAANTPSYVEQGWRWYKTDADTRSRSPGRALFGGRRGVTLNTCQGIADNHYVSGGWGGSLKVNFVD